MRTQRVHRKQEYASQVNDPIKAETDADLQPGNLQMCNVKRVCVYFQVIKGPFLLLFLDLWLCPAVTNLPLKVCLYNKKHASIDGFQVTG